MAWFLVVLGLYAVSDDRCPPPPPVSCADVCPSGLWRKTDGSCPWIGIVRRVERDRAAQCYVEN